MQHHSFTEQLLSLMSTVAKQSSSLHKWAMGVCIVWSVWYRQERLPATNSTIPLWSPVIALLSVWLLHELIQSSHTLCGRHSEKQIQWICAIIMYCNNFKDVMHYLFLFFYYLYLYSAFNNTDCVKVLNSIKSEDRVSVMYNNKIKHSIFSCPLSSILYPYMSNL